MYHRNFGKTGIKVSRIGFGTWGIGGKRAYGPKKDSISKAALEVAFDRGINFYDTANSYGDGHSEKLLGDVFKDRRDKVVLATKFGYLDEITNGKNQRFDHEHMGISLRNSLKRLQTDYIDIFQIHDCPLTELPEQTIEVLVELKKLGLIRAFGFAGKSIEDTLEVVKKYPVDCIQINFNLTDQRALVSGLLDECVKRGIAVISRGPLAFGYLAGKKTEHHMLHSEDHRTRFHGNQILKWRMGHDVFQSIFEKDHESATKSQKAITFCLSHPQITVVNCGMNDPFQVAENIGAVDFVPIVDFKLKQASRIYETFYNGPVLRKRILY
jgi:aryl-alcohol dehydrogenase-like predicted oxidoreductase